MCNTGFKEGTEQSDQNRVMKSSVCKADLEESIDRSESDYSNGRVCNAELEESFYRKE